MQEAEELRLKEERKIVAGYASGRKALQVNLIYDAYMYHY